MIKDDNSKIGIVGRDGWLLKVRSFCRSHRFWYKWNISRRQLNEYISNDSTCKVRNEYLLDETTTIFPSNADPRLFQIQISYPKRRMLKFRATDKRNRDAWVRAIASSIYVNPTSRLSIAMAGDVQYETFCLLRIDNRMKWSSLFRELNVELVLLFYTYCVLIFFLASSYLPIQAFRNDLAQLKWDQSKIETELNIIFDDKSSPIETVFSSFTNLFLQPLFEFSQENTNGNSIIDSLEKQIIKGVINFCIEDLKSFLKLSQQFLKLTLIPNSIQQQQQQQSSMKLVYDNDGITTYPLNLNQFLCQCVRQYVYKRVFSSELYNVLFSLYRRLHEDQDAQVFAWMQQHAHCKTKDYGIDNLLLQVDRDEHHQLLSFQQLVHQTVKMVKLNEKKLPMVEDTGDSIKETTNCESVRSVSLQESQPNQDRKSSNANDASDPYGRTIDQVQSILSTTYATDTVPYTTSNLTIDRSGKTLHVNNAEQMSMTKVKDQANPTAPLGTNKRDDTVQPMANPTISTSLSEVADKAILDVDPYISIEVSSALPVLQPCFDQLWKMKTCRSPLEKAWCLSELKEMLIACIGEYRHHRERLSGQGSGLESHALHVSESYTIDNNNGELDGSLVSWTSEKVNRVSDATSILTYHSIEPNHTKAVKPKMKEVLLYVASLLFSNLFCLLFFFACLWIVVLTKYYLFLHIAWLRVSSHQFMLRSHSLVICWVKNVSKRKKVFLSVDHRPLYSICLFICLFCS
ncbi:hypothetical protein RFI_36648 [Reticulomyxa filosa]|uniref:PH domain-containing protein n=1 Tax=Reticulomyxa filosa TaxID=46433 RepID=X6LI27_RETFI|nr:hypothetical protein RFI_36648 [Reticulomyxa filosa]|eukprot:ETO00792.1 hypothetical protein RFI_36648 [Reticulomyxa filosa]